MTSVKKKINFIHFKCYYRVERAGNLVVEKYRVNTENSADTSAACTCKYGSYAV